MEEENSRNNDEKNRNKHMRKENNLHIQAFHQLQSISFSLFFLQEGLEIFSYVSRPVVHFANKIKEYSSVENSTFIVQQPIIQVNHNADESVYSIDCCINACVTLFEKGDPCPKAINNGGQPPTELCRNECDYYTETCK
ncbi:hypothetical protein JTE90_014121 [Oedothorax gibbosus]|uniref:Kazal-like domain-containing protein n=1 Tax=Oedothorax gibbosus TaxID=931172 RepID=A0AAV6U492_9ARAC|nr:hypothetical protein JTE90_014121 [Oedothorax gibbosus]